MSLCDRVACTACSHPTLNKLWTLEGGHGAKGDKGFSSKSGVRAHLQKVENHDNSKVHKYCDSRYQWVQGKSQADTAVGRVFLRELLKHTNVLRAEGLDVHFQALEQLRGDQTGEKGEKTDKGKKDEEASSGEGGGAEVACSCAIIW